MCVTVRRRRSSKSPSHAVSTGRASYILSFTSGHRTTFWHYLGRHLHAVLLHGHDRLRDLDVHRLDDRLDVEGSLQPVGHQEHGVCHNTEDHMSAQRDETHASAGASLRINKTLSGACEGSALHRVATNVGPVQEHKAQRFPPSTLTAGNYKEREQEKQTWQGLYLSRTNRSHTVNGTYKRSAVWKKGCGTTNRN